MNIGIIGYGVIGKAVGDTFTSGNVYIYDVRNITEKEDNVIITDSILDLVERDVELIFICVPSPTIEGKFEDGYIISVLDSLKSLNTDIPIALKSTVPPDVLDTLFKKYSGVLNIYNPEFLRQNCATQDLLDIEKHYVYADAEKHYDAFRNYIDSSDCNKVIIEFDDYKKLSLLKYTANSFNATRVIFANCMYQIFAELDDSGMTFEEFMDIFGEFLELNKKRWGHNLRVPGPDGMFGYGGACLPKDVQALIEHSQENKCDEAHKFFKTLEEINNIIR